MPYLCVLINLPDLSLQTVNDQTSFPTNGSETVNNLQNLLGGINAGTTVASIQVTSLNNNISVSTDGGKSLQATYSFL